MPKLLPIIVGFLIVGAGAFYAGTQVGAKGSGPGGRVLGRNFANLANLSPEERAARFQQMGMSGGPGGAGGRGGLRGGDGFTAGEVIAKDEQSITVKLRDGGSKIIFLSATTPITKSAAGTLDDLAVGTQVTAAGTANTDGSLTAQSIQVRPPMPVTPPTPSANTNQ